MITRNRILSLCTIALLGTGLAACGSTTTSTKTTTASPTTEIKAAWKGFFEGSSPASTKIEDLQNGSSFTSVIDAQAKSSIARGTTVTVSKVSITSASRAAVTYTISLGGVPALKNQKGEAIKIDGKWKVGDSSFCGLLSLEGDKVPACASSSS